MPPKGSKKGVPSPTKEAAAISKTPVRRPPTTRRASPQKSPPKNTPRRTAMYKQGLTPAEATSASADEVPALPVSPAKRSKAAMEKRGLLGTNDNDDDPTIPTEEMLEAIDKRSLTAMDRSMIQAIKHMEEQGGPATAGLDTGHHVFQQEAEAAEKNLALNCHTKIYWRFHDMFRRRHGDPHAPAKTARGSGRAASRSPSKAPSPIRVPAAPRGLPSSRRSPDRITRPARSSARETANPLNRVAADSTGSSSRITKNTSAPLPASLPRGSPPTRRGRTPRGGDSFLAQLEQETYNAITAGKPAPRLPRNMPVSRAEAHTAQLAGYDRGDDDDDVVMTETGNQEPVSRAPSPIKPRSPRKQGPTERAPSPAKPRSPRKQGPTERAPSPAKPRSPGKQAVTEPAEDKIEPGRGPWTSSQNPKFIDVMRDGKLHHQMNPFHETMPAPEVWHRRMPPVFPFGETPYMAKVVSDQINADLSRNHADDDKTVQPAPSTSLVSQITSAPSRFASGIRGMISPTKLTAKEAEKPKKTASPWDLPKATAANMRRAHAAAKEFRFAQEALPKRKAPAAKGRPPKRPHV